MNINLWLFIPSAYTLFLCLVALFLRGARNSNEEEDMRHEVQCLYCNRVIDKNKLCGGGAYPKP